MQYFFVGHCLSCCVFSVCLLQSVLPFTACDCLLWYLPAFLPLGLCIYITFISFIGSFTCTYTGTNYFIVISLMCNFQLSLSVNYCIYKLSLCWMKIILACTRSGATKLNMDGTVMKRNKWSSGINIREVVVTSRLLGLYHNHIIYCIIN